jgi:hypothetical protein
MEQVNFAINKGLDQNSRNNLLRVSLNPSSKTL